MHRFIIGHLARKRVQKIKLVVNWYVSISLYFRLFNIIFYVIFFKARNYPKLPCDYSLLEPPSHAFNAELKQPEGSVSLCTTSQAVPTA